VAMTEAAVGAGLSGVVMALGLRRLGLWQVEDRQRAVAAEAGERLGLEKLSDAGAAKESTDV